MNAGTDLVGAWYELGATLSRGRPVDPVSGWPVLTTREAFELARSWALLLARLGRAVEPLAWRWLDESRALLADSIGADELLATSPALWEVGAELVAYLAPRNGFDPAASISVRFDENGHLVVSNVNDPNWLELALRRFFIAQGRTEKPRQKSRQDRPYVEITIGEAAQVIELWNRYAATAKPVDGYRDPRGPWRDFAAQASTVIAGKPPTDLYPVDQVEDLWIAQRRLGLDLSVLKDGQPPRGWSAYVAAAKATIADLAGGAVGAGGAVAGAVADAGGAVAKAAGGLLKPIAIGAGVIGAAVLVTALVRR